MNPDRKEEKDNAIKEKMKILLDLMKRLDQTKAYKSLLSTLWYASLPCYDIENVSGMRDGEKAVLKYCKWKGIPISCSAIFRPFPTDQGMCCSFNMKAADAIFQNGSYSRKISDLQNSDAAASFKNSSKPDWYLKTSEPTTLPGHNKGLFIVLDAHSDQFTTTSVYNDFDGFMGLINPSRSFPRTFYERFEIKPGHLNSISITAMKIDADDDMKDLNVDDRQCLFSYENSDLHIHQEYSFTNCMFECSILYAREQVPTKFFFFLYLLNSFEIQIKTICKSLNQRLIFMS